MQGHGTPSPEFLRSLMHDFHQDSRPLCSCQSRPCPNISARTFESSLAVGTSGFRTCRIFIFKKFESAQESQDPHGMAPHVSHVARARMLAKSFLVSCALFLLESSVIKHGTQKHELKMKKRGEDRRPPTSCEYLDPISHFLGGLSDSLSFEVLVSVLSFAFRVEW